MIERLKQILTIWMFPNLLRLSSTRAMITQINLIGARDYNNENGLEKTTIAVLLNLLAKKTQSLATLRRPVKNRSNREHSSR